MTNESIRELIKDIINVEEVMVNFYGELANSSTNKELKDQLNWIKKEEIKHKENAKKMMEILDS